MLLILGAASPLVALGFILLATALYPGFDNATQYLSELGGAKARYPVVFDLGLVAVGIGGAAAAAGFALAVPALGGGRASAAAVALCFLAAAVGLISGLVFPWPDPRHNLIQLGLGIQIAPLVLIVALRKDPGLVRLRRLLLAATIVMAALTVLTKHLVWPDLVNGANVGWWERGYAIVLVGWGGVAAILIERRLAELYRGRIGA